jgi:polyisoprenyl-teichoic acid--peptidoglycan teichoic acid transferase
VLSSVIIALLVSAFLYVFYSYEKYSHFNNNDYKTTNSEGKNTDVSKGENEDTKDLDDNISFKEIEGITNILLVGTDARTLNESARSDTIMILTLDDNHKKIKLTSIMRDTYVKIPNHGEQKNYPCFCLWGHRAIEKNN